MLQKILYITFLISMVLFCGCTQMTSTVEITPTPVAVTQTYIETPNVTVGPVPTKDENIGMSV